MAKKVFMIAPFEAMTGNLSGDQNLQYAENNNPAYEAPNGTQYARNYRTRYVGARRGRDGLVYFQVKQTTATVLTPSTRRTMAVLGVTAAIRSALQSSGQLDNLKAEFEILKQAGRLPEGQETFNKWFTGNIKSMLVYKRAEWRFTLPGVGVVTIHNPYDLQSNEALVIKTSIWVKFANFFAFSGTELNQQAFIYIDGNLLYVAATAQDELDMSVAKDFTNPNMVANLAAVTITTGTTQVVQYNGQTVYTPAGEVLYPVTILVDGTRYTTADPNI